MQMTLTLIGLAVSFFMLSTMRGRSSASAAKLSPIHRRANARL